MESSDKKSRITITEESNESDESSHNDHQISPLANSLDRQKNGPQRKASEVMISRIGDGLSK